MARVHDKVNDLQFTVTAEMSPAQVRKAGQDAIVAVKKVKELAVGEDGITYAVKGAAKVMTLMQFRVTWVRENERVLRVSLSVDDYTTTRMTVMFIPVTPKTAPALGSLRRFSEELRRQLVRI